MNALKTNRTGVEISRNINDICVLYIYLFEHTRVWRMRSVQSILLLPSREYCLTNRSCHLCSEGKLRLIIKAISATVDRYLSTCRVGSLPDRDLIPSLRLTLFCFREAMEGESFQIIFSRAALTFPTADFRQRKLDIFNDNLNRKISQSCPINAPIFSPLLTLLFSGREFKSDSELSLLRKRPE